MKLFYNKAATVTSSRPGLVLAFSLAFILLFSIGIYRITIDTSLDGVFSETNPLVLELKDFKKTFASDNKILIGVETAHLLSQKNVAFLRKLSTQLTEFPEVAKVVGLPTLKVPYGQNNKLSFKPALKTDPEILLAHPLFRSTLISTDKHATLLQLYPEGGEWPPDFPRRLASFIRELSSDTTHLYLAGVPILEQEIVESIYHDLFFLPPIVGLVLIAFLIFIWHDFACTILCLGAVSLTLTTTLGIMGWSSHPITVLTPVMPPLLMAATFASAAHILSAIKKIGSDNLPSVFARVFSPCLFAALTTGAGFGSLIFNPVIQVKTFGFFSMLGIFISFLVVFGCIVPMACILKIPQGKTRSFIFLEKFLTRLNTLTKKSYLSIVFAFSSVMVMLLLFLPGLKVDISVFDNIDSGGEAYRGYQFFQNNFNGVATLELDLQSKDGLIIDPQILAGMLALGTELKKDARVNGVISIADFIVYLQGLVSPQTDISDQSGAELNQLLFLYRLSGYGIVIDEYISTKRDRSRLTVMVGNMSAGEFFTLSEKVQKLARAHLPENVQITATGSVEMYSQLNRQLFSGLVKSLGAAFIVVGVLLVLFLRSTILGMLAFLPNVFPLIIIYGTMRLFNLSLDAQTAMIGCISLGISVDGTVHLLHNHRSICTTTNPVGNIDKVWLSIGVPVLIATLILIVVFSLLCISSFRPIRIFGILSALGLVSALLADLLYLPALLYICRRS